MMRSKSYECSKLTLPSTVLTIGGLETHPADLRGNSVLDWYIDNFDPSSTISRMAGHIKSIILSFEEGHFEKAEELIFQELGLCTIDSLLFILDESATVDNIGPKLRQADFDVRDNRRRLSLPNFTVQLFMQACSIDEEFAKVIIPVLIKQWLHAFQNEIDGFLSPDTIAFHGTGRRQADDYDLLEVDICAFYRDLGWGIDVRRPFFKRYKCCQDFREFVANRHLAQRAYNQYCKARRKLKQARRKSQPDLTASLGAKASSKKKMFSRSGCKVHPVAETSSKVRRNRSLHDIEVSRGNKTSFKRRSLPDITDSRGKGIFTGDKQVLDSLKDLNLLDQSQRTAPLDLSQRTEQSDYGEDLYYQFVNLLDTSRRSSCPELAG